MATIASGDNEALAGINGSDSNGQVIRAGGTDDSDSDSDEQVIHAGGTNSSDSNGPVFRAPIAVMVESLQKDQAKFRSIMDTLNQSRIYVAVPGSRSTKYQIEEKKLPTLPIELRVRIYRIAFRTPQIHVLGRNGAISASQINKIVNSSVEAREEAAKFGLDRVVFHDINTDYPGCARTRRSLNYVNLATDTFWIDQRWCDGVPADIHIRCGKCTPVGADEYDTCACGRVNRIGIARVTMFNSMSGLAIKSEKLAWSMHGAYRGAFRDIPMIMRSGARELFVVVSSYITDRKQVVKFVKPRGDPHVYSDNIIWSQKKNWGHLEVIVEERMKAYKEFEIEARAKAILRS